MREGFQVKKEVQMSEGDNDTSVRHFLDEAYNKRNLTVGDELLVEDCVFHAIPKSIQGIAGWKMYATAFLTAFPDDLQVTIEDSFATGDKVAARWIAQGTHKGPLRGIAPTCKEVRWLGVALYYFSGGKIKEIWGLNDMLGMMQQIGVIP
jgi:predicted ester cyclase